MNCLHSNFYSLLRVLTCETIKFEVKDLQGEKKIL